MKRGHSRFFGRGKNVNAPFLSSVVTAASVDAAGLVDGAVDVVGLLPPGGVAVVEDAVEGLDERLAVLVVPEADAGRLAVLDAAAGGRPLPEVVVQAVHSQAQRDGELVGRHEAAARGADTIDALRVAGRLRLGEVIVA